MENDFAQYLAGLRASARNDDVSMPLTPEHNVCTQNTESKPDFYQRQIAREGRSEWSGNTWIDRSW